MYKKAQFDEINLVGIIGGLITGCIAVIVSSSVDNGFGWKAMTFIASAVVGYFIVAKMSNN